MISMPTTIASQSSVASNSVYPGSNGGNCNNRPKTGVHSLARAEQCLVTLCHVVKGARNIQHLSQLVDQRALETCIGHQPLARRWKHSICLSSLYPMPTESDRIRDWSLGCLILWWGCTMMRLEIAGGIGAGKTTLAHVLAQAWGSVLVHEDVLKVPFFSKFYAEPQTYGFEKNISFLLSHADLIRDAAIKNEGLVMCDFALFQDLSYTDVGCSPADAVAVEGVYHRLIDRVGHPSLVVHLQCTPDTQLQRIASRGRSQEAGIGRAYLVDLCEAIDRRLEQLRLEAPDLAIIKVDTEEADFATDPAAARAVVGELIRFLQSPTPLYASAARTVGNQT
jgi:deoxyadenosine/deoxycytidine kinase